MIFQADTKPEYKNQGGGDCPPPAMSRVTLPHWGAGFSLTGCTASPAYATLYGGGIHNKKD